MYKDDSTTGHPKDVQTENRLSPETDKCPTICPNTTNCNDKEKLSTGTKGTKHSETDLEAAAEEKIKKDNGATESEKIITIFPLDYYGMAMRLIHGFPREIYYCRDTGNWKVWDSIKFTSDRIKVARMVKAVIVHLKYERPEDKKNTKRYKDTDGNDVERKDLLKFVKNLKRGNAIKAIQAIARLDEKIEAKESDFDSNQHLLNCPNGIIDLKTGELLEHDPAYKMTHIAGIEYDPYAKSDMVDKFIKDITNDNHELANYLQIASGYGLTGSTKEQVFFILYGPNGSNGKSTLLNLIHRVCGTYAMKTPMNTLLKTKFGGINNDIARLKGARFVSAVEANQGRQLDEAKIKQLTGNDPITSRFLFQEFFEYSPEFKLFMAVNDLPDVAASDDAMFRRIRVIPFDAQFKGDNLIKDLQEELSQPEHLKALLAWMVEGAKKWYAEGLPQSAAVEKATNLYRQDSDILEQFVADMCIVGDEKKFQVSDLYKHFQEWATNNGFRPMNNREIRGLLTKKGFSQTKSGSSRFWKGLELNRKCK